MGEKVGRLTGRLEAAEGRLDRHESYVVAQITAMNVKLDNLAAQIAIGTGGFSLLTLIWTGGGGLALGYVTLKALGAH